LDLEVHDGMVTDPRGSLAEEWERLNGRIANWETLRATIRNVGEALFAALVRDEPVHVRYQQEMSKVEASWRGQSPVILHLRMSFANAVLARWPWDLPYAGGRTLFLSASDHVVISRSLGGEDLKAPPDWRPPLRLLVVMASPLVARQPDWRLPA